MDQKTIRTKPERKPPVPSDFWYNFDSKRFKIQKKKVWSHNRRAPEDAEGHKSIKIPVPFVYMSFGTITAGVHSQAGEYWSKMLGPRPSTTQVIKAMQDLQKREYNLKKPEIRYNFMVGGDGVVYEGRGWENRPALPKKYWYNMDKSIYIGFIGNWEKTPPPKQLLNLKDEVIKIGIERKVIKIKHVQIVLEFPCQYVSKLNYHLS